ncbi:hypothetical protein BDEG_28144 [Batrachochytrium dendrobatidis JEL423]|uniref:Uncharacterized protein n=1 Tax=Batrachochytrium dendrobatidis (strain JEL423) TaxID=403673 RepID=A0A177WXY2_BATDL|nr:hypothetical protein BDEG_28144 [Batrachochytrium dendrobatidis JEL423]
MALKKLEPNIKYVRVLVQEDKDCTFQEFSCCFHASHPMFISNAQLRKRKVGGWKDVKDVNIRSVFLYKNEHKVQSTKEFKEHVVVQPVVDMTRRLDDLVRSMPLSITFALIQCPLSPLSSMVVDSLPYLELAVYLVICMSISTIGQNLAAWTY